MPHLDEGLLHAYLDGELNAEGQRGRDAEAAEQFPQSIEQVERHLHECADCRERLEEARTSKDSATRILSGSGPSDLAKPTFEELVARAQARKEDKAEGQRSRGAEEQQRQLGKMRSLAWAAVVVLAAATGWYARSTLVQDDRGRVMSEDDASGRLSVTVPQTKPEESRSSGAGTAENTSAPSAEATGVATPSTTDAIVQEHPEPEEEATVVGGVSVGAEPPSAAMPQAAMAFDAASEARTVTAKGAEGAQISPNADSLSRDLLGRVVTVESVVVSEEPTDQARRARERAPVPATQQVAGAPEVPRATVALREPTAVEDDTDVLWTVVDVETAAAGFGQPVPVVNGLEVVSYEIASVAGVHAVRVFQTLDPGVLIELIISNQAYAGLFDPQNRMASVDAVAMADATGQNTTTVQQGNLAVRLSATIPTDSLRTLGERLRVP